MSLCIEEADVNLFAYSQIKRHKEQLEATEELLADERRTVENLNANIESSNKEKNELMQNLEDLETQIEEVNTRELTKTDFATQ